MNKITQKGITPPAPSYLKRGKIRWGKDLWLLALCFCSVMFFCLGLYLGGLTMRNKVAAVAAEMEKTQRQLEDSTNSVILIDKDFAVQMGYHPGKKDLVCTSGGI